MKQKTIQYLIGFYLLVFASLAANAQELKLEILNGHSGGGEVDMSQVGIGNAAKANGVQLFDVETGKEIESFGGEFKSSANKFTGFKSVTCSPDGKYIAAGSFDGKVYLRDNETKTLRKFEGHTDTVNFVKFAKDANGNLLVVSGSSDSTTRIWNAATGEEICALVTFRDGNWAVVQTHTGRYDAPNGGEIDGIQWVFGNEVIALSQLKDIYYTPNLLPRLLGYNQEPLAEVRPLSDIKLFPEIVESEIGSKDAVAKNPERAISNTEILDWLTQEQWRTDKKGIDARNQVLILDTCAAGAFENALTKNKQRDLSADQIRALEKLKDRTGLQILMGSAANQSAYEASQYGQGLLTYALLEGIKGAALKNQTSVETGTLFDWAVNRVPKMDISGGASGLQSPRVFGSTSIPIGLITTQVDRDAIKIQASPLPIFGRPSLIKKGDNDDTLELGNAFAKRLDEAGNPNSRGNGGNQTSASLVFVDERNFPGAYRVTATYTEENGVITLEEITLKKDGKTVATIAEKISAKDADEAAEKLLKEVLKEMKKLNFQTE